MAVSAPGDTPSGDGQVDPNVLQRLWAYINPTPAANAAPVNSVTQAPNPLTSPTPVPQALQGGGPPVPSSLAGPPAAPVQGPPQSPTPWFTSSNTPYAPNPAAGAPMPPVRPAANPAVARGGNRPGVTPTNTPAPTGPDNTFQYIVPNSTASRAPIYTAGNFSGLFGGGANPANVPAANAQPVNASAPVGGPLAKGGMSNAPWTYGPQQSKVGWSKRKYGPDDVDAAAGRSGFA